MTTNRLIALIAIALAACNPRNSAPPATSPQSVAPITAAATPAAAPVPMPPNALSNGLLENMYIIATGQRSTPAVIEQWQRKITTGSAKLDDFIDELVHQPEFAKTVAPRILMRSGMRIGNTKLSLRLKKKEIAGKTIYHLRKPCDPTQAVPVTAWWLDGKQTVLVCPDSYLPDHDVIPGKDWYCGGGNTNPLLSPTDAYCGCGKDLMYCYPDELWMKAMKEMQNEVSDTIAYVVDKDLPIERIFLQNETVRSGLADHHYEVWDVMNGKREHHRPPTSGTRLAPRDEYYPGMHAGILTTPHMLFMGDAQRPRINRASYMLFCTPFKSAMVTTHAVLGLRAGDTRNGEGWKSLVKLPGCTNCHARLDYGVRFFAGWLDVRKSIGFHMDHVVNEEGRLYLADHTDLRGTAPVATPRAFAELAVKQPEFAKCQAQTVLDYVVGDHTTESMRKAVEATATPKPKMRDMMKVALRAYAERYNQKVAAPPAFAAAPAGVTGGTVTVTPELKVQLEGCTDCHDGSRPELPSFAKDTLPTSVLQAAITKVAFRAMPPEGFAEEERDAFLRASIGLAWPQTPAETYTFFQNQMRSVMVHHIGSVLNMVAPPPAQVDDALPEIAVEQRYAQLTPSLTASMLLQRLKTCKASVAAKKHSSVRACMDELKLESMVRSPD
ncbi:MAG TPA: hypothetical protein VL326_09790 [Kofleriaceae bacterium]|nr:hypothetical protein [Kofleriaceae bacterium]